MSLLDWQREHAENVFKTLLTKGHVHDGSDGGSGKTYIACEVLPRLNEVPTIICPKSVRPNWYRVLKDFGVPAHVFTYGQAWRHLGELKKCGKGSYFVFHRRHPIILFDEVHHCGGMSSNLSKVLIGARRVGSKIYTLSATPADNPLKMKAFGYSHKMYDQTREYAHWTMQHGAFKDGLGRLQWKRAEAVKYNHMDRLHHRMYGPNGFGFRLRKEEIPNFPKTIVDTMPLDYTQLNAKIRKMDDHLQELYEEYQTHADLSDEAIISELRWRQISELAKVEDLAELVIDAREGGMRSAVFVNYTETRFALIEKLKKKTDFVLADVFGGQTETQRQQVCTSFQRNEIDCLVLQIDAGGEGISLHDPVDKQPRASFICPTYKPTTLHQTLQRVNRVGGGFSLQKLVYFDGGIEQKVADAVRVKLNCIDQLNDGELSGIGL
jgi:hypothetical protein